MSQNFERLIRKQCHVRLETTPLPDVAGYTDRDEDVYIRSKMALGRSAGVSRAVIAASITSNEASELQSQIRAIKDKVERLVI